MKCPYCDSEDILEDEWEQRIHCNACKRYWHSRTPYRRPRDLMTDLGKWNPDGGWSREDMPDEWEIGDYEGEREIEDYRDEEDDGEDDEEN